MKLLKKIDANLTNGQNKTIEFGHPTGESELQEMYKFRNDVYVKKHYFSYVNVNFRPKYRFLHSFFIKYDHLYYHDSVLTLNPGFTYGNNIYNYFSFIYKFKLDYRDYKPYPLEGYYFDVSFMKKGLGILSKIARYFASDFCSSCSRTFR